MGGRGAVRLEARVEVFGGLEGQAVLLQQRFEVGDAGLEVPDVAASWSVAEPRRIERSRAAPRQKNSAGVLTCAESRAS